jgi:hypothetical protein
VFLKQFMSTIDYPKGRLILRAKGDETETSGKGEVISIPFLLGGDHYMFAEGSLNDGPVCQFFVDTGLAGAAFT